MSATAGTAGNGGSGGNGGNGADAAFERQGQHHADDGGNGGFLGGGGGGAAEVQPTAGSVTSPVHSPLGERCCAGDPNSAPGSIVHLGPHDGWH